MGQRSNKAAHHNSNIQQWLPLVLLVVGLYVIVPELHSFRASLTSLHKLEYRQLGLSLVFVCLTFVFAAAVYTALGLRALRYGKTLVAEVAANFINRILPAGLGGIGANYRYLRQQKHSSAQAASVVAVNNGLGLIGHVSLVIVLSLLFHGRGESIHVASRIKIGLAIGIGLLILSLIASSKLRARIGRTLKSFAGQLRLYQSNPYKVPLALGLQICLTLSNITAFWLCVHATHVPLDFVTALLVFTLGFGVGAATPTPGGLGGVEAGLVAGLVAYHVASPQAIAVVLVYRLASYWLPLLVSGLALIYATRRHYFS